MLFNIKYNIYLATRMATITAVLPFQPETESVTEFLQRFKLQNFQSLQAAEEDSVKAAMLCRALPVNIITDIQRRIKPALLTAATYDQIEQNLKAQFDVKKSVIGSAVKFINRKQQPSESIETYAKILNDLASQCEYSDCCRDRLLRDIFVSGLHSAKLISTLLQECETKTFNQCVERAKLIEQLAHDAADMKPEAKFLQFKVDKQQSASKLNRSSEKVPDSYICIRCGARAKHLAQKCFALKLKCNLCTKIGHLAKVCKSKKINAVLESDDNVSWEVPANRERGIRMVTSQSAMTHRAEPSLCTNEKKESTQCNSCGSQLSCRSSCKVYDNNSFLL